jgi:hypothetical protein
VDIKVKFSLHASSKAIDDGKYTIPVDNSIATVKDWFRKHIGKLRQFGNVGDLHLLVDRVDGEHLTSVSDLRTANLLVVYEQTSPKKTTLENFSDAGSAFVKTLKALFDDAQSYEPLPQEEKGAREKND